VEEIGGGREGVGVGRATEIRGGMTEMGGRRRGREGGGREGIREVERGCGEERWEGEEKRWEGGGGCGWVEGGVGGGGGG